MKQKRTEFSADSAPDLLQQTAEEQVRLLSEVTQDLVWDWDLETNRAIYNERFIEVFGAAPERYSEALEWWWSRVHPDDAGPLRTRYDHAAAGGGTQLAHEYRILDAAGDFRVLDSRITFLRDANGELMRVLAASRDISHRQRAEEAQSRLTSILEATTDLVALGRAQDQTLFYLNAAGRKMIGLGADEPLDVRIPQLHPEWANEIVLKEAIPTAMREGSWHGETALRHRDGHEIPVSQMVLSHPGRDGSIQYISTIIRDLTEQKRADVARIEWANRYDAAIRASGQVLFDWNSFTHEITYAGDVERMFGFTLAEMGGGLDRFRQLIHPDDLKRFDQQVQQVIVTRDPFHLEFRVQHKFNGFVFIEAKGYFFLDRTGQIGRMVGFFDDISIQRRAQDELARAHENLENRVIERTLELARASAVIEDRVRQQEAVALLGQRALSGLSVSALSMEAMRSLKKILRVDCASLLALTIDGSEFVVRAQIGWPDAESDNRVPLARQSMSGYTMLTRDPVIVEDFDTEQRFRKSPAIVKAGLRSGVSVMIETDDGPLGVLAAFTFAPRKFVQDDIHFLQGVANVLTAAIQRERAEERVRQAREQAEQASRAKSEFLSRMSHELRTPLNAILGFTQLLELESPTPGQAESVQHISRAGRHLLNLINEVLDISRIEAGRLALTSERIDLPEFLALAMDSVRASAEQQGITLTLEPSAARPPHCVIADRHRLQQVMANLLSNAVKFNRPNGRVTVSFRDDGANLRIAVTDTGRGIAPEQMARLFLPFERLGVESNDGAGAGIGLALSRGIVTALGGELNVESRVGEGSTFWLTLPRPREYPPATAEMMDADLPVAPTESEPAPVPDARVFTLLYIEDQTLNIRLVERIIQTHSAYRLLTAMQGRLGLQIARKHLPDLILLDLNLPDMRGDEVLRTLKEDPELRHIPVLMVSADAMDDRIRSLLDLGAAGYLTKPYKVHQFLRAVEDALRTADPEVSSSSIPPARSASPP